MSKTREVAEKYAELVKAGEMERTAACKRAAKEAGIHPTGMQRQFKKLLGPAAPVVGNGEHLAGIALRPDTVVLSAKPAGRAKGLIYSLPKDRAFPIVELVERWGMSEDTISKHAKRYGAIGYVERSPGNTVKCVIHPDTMAKKRRT